MEFQEFWEEKRRMCNSIGECCNCELESKYSDCFYGILNNTQRAEKIVQKWADEHPVQTNADKFKEVFGYEAFYLIPFDDYWNKEYKKPKSEVE